MLSITGTLFRHGRAGTRGGEGDAASTNFWASRVSPVPAPSPAPGYGQIQLQDHGPPEFAVDEQD